MGPIKKAADGARSHTGRHSQAKAERAEAAAVQAQAEQAEQAETSAKVAQEQAAAIARGLREDQAQRQVDLHEVAEAEAEAMPPWPPGS